MIKLTTSEQEFLVCDCWADVNYGQYIDMCHIDSDKTLSQTAKAIKLVAAFSDKPEELERLLLTEWDITDLKDLINFMKWMETDIASEAKESTKKKEFIIEGRKFELKPNYSSISNEEQISIEILLDQKNLHPHEIALGVLLREVVDGKQKLFDMDDFMEIVTELKYKINLLDAYNFIVFFSSGETKPTTSTTKRFSVQKLPKKD